MIGDVERVEQTILVELTENLRDSIRSIGDNDTRFRRDMEWLRERTRISVDDARGLLRRLELQADPDDDDIACHVDDVVAWLAEEIKFADAEMEKYLAAMKGAA